MAAGQRLKHKAGSGGLGCSLRQLPSLLQAAGLPYGLGAGNATSNHMQCAKSL